MHDLQAGRIDYLCDIIATAKPQIDGGTVKGIAIMTKERSPVLPDLPTTGEQGVDVQAYTWSALFLPKGAPPAVVKKLNEAAVETINTPAVKESLAKLQPLVATRNCRLLSDETIRSIRPRSGRLLPHRSTLFCFRRHRTRPPPMRHRS